MSSELSGDETSDLRLCDMRVIGADNQGLKALIIRSCLAVGLI